jgi:hypothetical protein
VATICNYSISHYCGGGYSSGYSFTTLGYTWNLPELPAVTSCKSCKSCNTRTWTWAFGLILYWSSLRLVFILNLLQYLVKYISLYFCTNVALCCTAQSRYLLYSCWRVWQFLSVVGPYVRILILSTNPVVLAWYSVLLYTCTSSLL